MGMLLSSSALITPIWTSAFAPPQPRASPILGWRMTGSWIAGCGLIILLMNEGSFMG